MPPQSFAPPRARRSDVGPAALRIARSVAARTGPIAGLEDFHHWLCAYRRRAYMDVRQVPLESLQDWYAEGGTGNIRHRTGRYFSVEGVDVHAADGVVDRWQQPIIHQAETGLLGIVAREFDGVLHLLMQAKAEPGNCNGLQVSPTVQATRSNFSRVHRGAAVPYLDYFRAGAAARVLADSRQSEQGSWFFRKRNRNMVVEVDGEVDVLDGFCWLTLGQVHQLLGLDDAVNMDARTVLACLPFAGPGLLRAYGAELGPFTAALVRSCGGDDEALWALDEVLSWLTDLRAEHRGTAERIALREVAGWQCAGGRITHESGRFFNVVGVSVTAAGREVRSWTQPMIEPCDEGLIAFLAKRINGVLHLLVQARAEPGFVDGVELGPTVQCTPSNYAGLPDAAAPEFLDDVLGAGPERIRYDVILSEEGGRFHHARNRYAVVEVGEGFEPRHPRYRWLTLGQLSALLRHSYYVNIQARSLVACLHSLITGTA
ncbi:NDP-hexose 2,3-dehydratase [Pilimelia anulata]|uniref:NDP-hexose 2,3-dehydratase n=1 Tax=Pilimelia anulata TaxID=53371 RepID=A0A8J3FBI8_9ACTN|nr:NDP-hexose 2,3-dehydratase family protein [Pilimelia anulata]GGJ96436.1 NDP-hexose 2,3-dehydratase [Pilimelia anulata]